MAENRSKTNELMVAGVKALQEALGPIGAARFVQLIRSGSGDYTKEKYEREELEAEEAKELIMQYNRPTYTQPIR